MYPAASHGVLGRGPQQTAVPLHERTILSLAGAQVSKHVYPPNSHGVPAAFAFFAKNEEKRKKNIKSENINIFFTVLSYSKKEIKSKWTMRQI